MPLFLKADAAATGTTRAETVAREGWIEFEWRDLSRLDDLLPVAFRSLSAGAAVFAP